MEEKSRNFLNHFVTIALGVSIVLFVWTFSIGLPIYARGFYYSQIDTLQIEQNSGYSKETIKEAYDDVLDYLTKGKEFGTGTLKCSESARTHFADCKVLFNINLSLMIVSVVCIVAIVVFAFAKFIELKKYRGFNIWFFSGIVAVTFPLLVFAVALTDFDTAFVVFHKILFPGKTNWYFDPSKDEIIKILPEQFFANCGILIGCSIVCFSIAFIAFDIVKKTKKSVVYYKIVDVQNNLNANGLPQQVVKHISEYKNESRKAESACAWVALNELLKEKFRMSLDGLDVKFSPRGKPLTKNVFVGIGHSKGKCAVCCSRVPCSIDIEKCEEKNYEAISKRLFGNVVCDQDSFYKEWTKTEAVAKLKDIEIGEAKNIKEKIHFLHIMDENYWICVASEERFKIEK